MSTLYQGDHMSTENLTSKEIMDDSQNSSDALESSTHNAKGDHMSTENLTSKEIMDDSQNSSDALESSTHNAKGDHMSTENLTSKEIMDDSQNSSDALESSTHNAKGDHMSTENLTSKEIMDDSQNSSDALESSTHNAKGDHMSTENLTSKEIMDDSQNSSDALESSTHNAKGDHMSTENLTSKEIMDDSQNSSDALESSTHNAKGDHMSTENLTSKEIMDDSQNSSDALESSTHNAKGDHMSTENLTSKEIMDDSQNSSDALESSTHNAKISTDQALRPEAINIDEMEFNDVEILLQQLGVKISADSGLNINVLKEKLYGGRGRGPSDEKAKHMVDITMKKHKAVKRQLLESYLNFIDITNMDTFKNELRKPLKKRFSDFSTEMRNTLKTLMEDSSEFQIVVIGETSAGKSTFLNILLGEKILPSALLHTTSCICRLHNSSDKKVSYGDKDGNNTLQLTSDDPNEIEQTLLKIIGPTKDNNTKSLGVVDIYWPIPLLQEDVILVNTPGIGNTNFLTKQIVEYVPNADGYICIIDSSHAGGVQEDRIQFLLREIRKKQGPEMKDFSNVMFICNKWDRVQREVVDSVWHDTLEKLELVCGSLAKWQVIKFCSTLELKLLHLKANHTDAYADILTGIENVLLGAMYKRTGCKLEWIHKFMTEMNNLIDIQIAGAGSDLSILQTKAAAAKEILASGSAKLSKETNDALEHVQKKTAYLAKELRDHLERPETFETLVNRLGNNLTLSWLRMGANVSEHQSHHMEMICLRWIRDGPIREESETMEEKINKLESQMKTTLQTIEWFGFQTTFARNEGGFLSKIKRWDGPGPIQSSIGVTVCLAIGLMFVPFTMELSMLLPLVISSVYLFVRLRSMLINRMARSAIEHAKAQSVVKAFVHDCFEMPYTEKINKLKKDFECTMNFILKTIVKMEKDARNKRNLSSVLHQFKNKIKDYLRRLQFVNSLYGDQYIVLTEHLRIGKVLSKTDVFHLHIVENDFQGKRITLRVLDSSFSVFYLKEIENIRAMKHENVVSHLAIAFSTSSLKELPDSAATCDCNDNSLKVLIEPSDGDLETYVFSNRNKIGCVVGECATATFVQISSGISNGLAYIHSKGFVHGQLQLSAVLLCGTAMVPKLCDVNVLPYYKDRNHEQCIYHTAPEVIKDGTYGPEADVYSYGILLWELWYGRHTKRNEALSRQSVCSGERPTFEDIRPPIIVETFIAMCWDGDKDKRPTAKGVCECLLKLIKPVVTAAK